MKECRHTIAVDYYESTAGVAACSKTSLDLVEYASMQSISAFLGLSSGKLLLSPVHEKSVAMGYLIFTLAVVVGSVAASLAVLWIVRKWIGMEVLRKHHEMTGYIFAVVGTLNAVLLGMVVIEAQSRFQQARTNEAAEASCIADVRLYGEHLPEPTRSKVDEHVRKYIQVVLEEEWDAPADKQPDPNAVKEIHSVWNAVSKFSPANNREQNLQSIMLSEMSQAFDLRRFRITTGRHGIPTVLWAVMITGAVITELFSLMFASDSLRLQGFMVSLLAVTLSMSMLVVYVLGTPYRGDWKMRPEQFMRMANNKPFRALRNGEEVEDDATPTGPLSPPK
jgi:Protein of unknown function (DUF4239)